jgi:cytochrome P450
VIPCTYLAQHDPKVFPDPHEFQPERFMNGQRYEHSYFPFGFGNRTCVGKPFASRQMLLIVATATQCVELELAPGYRVKPARHLVVIVPAGGGLMQKSQPRAAIATPVFASKVR